MKRVDTIARVRRAFYVQGWSVKRIVRELHVSRNTVRKILRSDETDFSYERERRPMSRIVPWQGQLEQFLSSNANKPSRERLTLIRIFEELRGLGYEGGYDAVRRFAKGWSQNRGVVTAEAYVPLYYAPGEAYQFDWSHEIVVISGVTVTIKVAHLRLCHSRMMYARAYMRESQEMVFDAHDRGFAFFKGKRQHEPPRIVGDLLQSEIAEKQARSVRYQMTVAKLPPAKDIEEFDFTGTPINEGLVRELANGSFVADQRNVVLIGGTGTGKTHLAIAIARALIRNGTRGRFYNVVDLVEPARDRDPWRQAGAAGRLHDPPRLRHPRRAWLSAICPIRRTAALPLDQPPLRAHLDHRHNQPRLRRMADRVRRRNDDHGAPRPPDPSLRDHRNRQ